jgi:hypothetical protein
MCRVTSENRLMTDPAGTHAAHLHLTCSRFTDFPTGTAVDPAHNRWDSFLTAQQTDTVVNSNKVTASGPGAHLGKAHTHTHVNAT